MQQKHYLPLIIVIFFFNITNICATNQGIWKDKIVKEQTIRQNQQKLPQDYRTLELDIAQLQGILSEAPQRFSPSVQTKKVQIPIPLPTGETIDFKVVESPIMAPELAEKFPNIKTYEGVSTDGDFHHIRFTITSKGINVISYNDESFYIEPAKNDKTTYLSYYTKDLPNTEKEWLCATQSKVKKSIESIPLKSVTNDCQLRSYRLAVAATGEYTQALGGTLEDGMAGIITSINSIVGVFERDLGVTFELVANNDLIIYTDATTDPYGDVIETMIVENQTNLDSVLGFENYDVGHVFTTIPVGFAYDNIICSEMKAYGASGYAEPEGFFFDFGLVAHELGHQFGAHHTFNASCGGNRYDATAVEPGSGTTIMSYAGACGDDNVSIVPSSYFHGVSIIEIKNHISGSGNDCATIINTNNNTPIVDAGEDYIIPIGTPFILTGDVVASTEDNLSYCWEQIDNEILTSIYPIDGEAEEGPSFRSYPYKEVPYRIFPDQAYRTATPNKKWGTLKTIDYEMDFLLTIRSNNLFSHCTTQDSMKVTTTEQAGPFIVDPINTTWYVGDTILITWDVANTNSSPINCTEVDISLSLNDGVDLYPITLAENVPNNGEYYIIVPNHIGDNSQIKISSVDNIFFAVSNSINIEFNNEDFNFVVPEEINTCIGNEATYIIETISLNDFEGTIDFSVGSLPENVNAEFYPNPVLAGDTTILTISTNIDTPSDNYNFIVNGLIEEGTSIYTTTNLIVEKSIIKSPFLEFPIFDTGNYFSSFSWGEVAGATSYLLEVALDSMFSNIIFSEIQTGSYIYREEGFNLNFDTKYYWRVSGINECGKGVPSVAESFIIDDYCISQGNTTDEWIESIQIGEVENFSGDNEGYGDFINTIIYLETGQTYNVSLMPGYTDSEYEERWLIWIDFYKNGALPGSNFWDLGEDDLVYYNKAYGLSEGTITIPNDAPLGETRMRIQMQYPYGWTLGSCGMYQYGETEDYTVIITSNCENIDNDNYCDEYDICLEGDDDVDSDGDGIPDACDDDLVNVELDLKVLLEGAYLGDGQMQTTLNDNALLPLQHPYENEPYEIPANLVINSLPNDMVDWVVVELRSGDNHELTLAKTVGVLLANGSIKDLNGIDNLNIELIEEDSYSIIIRHRNHLDIISATPIDYAAVLSYDFTLNKNQVLDGKQTDLLDGYAAMYTGDGTQDLIIQLTDFDLWKTNPAQINSYNISDFVMDGIIQVTDYDAWVKNKAVIGPPQLGY